MTGCLKMGRFGDETGFYFNTKVPIKTIKTDLEIKSLPKKHIRPSIETNINVILNLSILYYIHSDSEKGSK